MQKTKIEWLHWPDGKPGYSWNPIKGICPQGCWYCYARKIYKRFKLDPRLTHVLKPPFPKRPSRIFVCSTIEIFHPSIPREWRDLVFRNIESHPEHTFFILTKRPENIGLYMPENVFLGVSCDGEHWETDNERIENLCYSSAQHKFISFEPLLEKAGLRDINEQINWIIIGRLTGHGPKYGPKLEWIEEIVRPAGEASVPVFLKNNLSGIWPGKLIQGFPHGI